MVPNSAYPVLRSPTPPDLGSGMPHSPTSMDITQRTLMLCAFLLAWANVAPAQDGAPPAPVVVSQATRQTLSPVTWFPGTVISRNDSRLAAEEEGRLMEVADIGTMVASGTVVARLDDTLLGQELVEDEAEVDRERARLAFYAGEVKRLEKLATDNNVAQNQLDEAISNRAVTRSELVAAKARVAFTQARLHRTAVRAPFAGVVTERLMQAGEWAESGKAVVRLVDNRSVEVQTWVPVNALSFVREASTLDLKANPHTAVGRVRTIVPVGDDRSRLYELRISVPDDMWPAGQTLRVAVPTAAPKSVVAVPRDALVLRRDGTTVFRILEDDTAQAVSIETGIASGELIEVTGVQAGDRVVIRGGERLRSGQKVQIVSTPGTQ